MNLAFRPVLAALWRVLRAVQSILLNERCCLCGEASEGGELCASCLFRLPYSQLRGERGNVVERSFWGEAAVQRVSAYLWYKPEYASAKVVHAFKYHGHRRLARQMGRLMAAELLSTDFFDDIDALIPIPLSRQRQAQRGYNQSQLLAEGVAELTGLPVLSDAVARIVDNPSQTSLSREARRQNVAGIFALLRPEQLEGKHLLLIDDVMTLGATMRSLVRTLERLPSVRVSLLSLCAAGRYRHGRITAADLRLPDLTRRFDPRTLRRYVPPQGR